MLPPIKFPLALTDWFPLATEEANTRWLSDGPVKQNVDRQTKKIARSWVKISLFTNTRAFSNYIYDDI